MKKILAGAAVVGLLAFSGVQLATARGGFDQIGGYGYCGSPIDDDTAGNSKVLNDFRTETNEIRKSIAVKRSELRALHNQTNPDAKRIAQLTGELFDLESDLNDKATAKGLSNRSFYGHGPEMMYGNGGRYNRNMMDW